jgi:hypothetical protein
MAEESHMHESFLSGDAEAQGVLRASEAEQEVPAVLADLVTTELHEGIADESTCHPHDSLRSLHAPCIDILHHVADNCISNICDQIVVPLIVGGTTNDASSIPVSYVKVRQVKEMI